MSRNTKIWLLICLQVLNLSKSNVYSFTIHHYSSKLHCQSRLLLSAETSSESLNHQNSDQSEQDDDETMNNDTMNNDTMNNDTMNNDTIMKSEILSTASSTSTSDDIVIQQNQNQLEISLDSKRKKMELAWCGRDTCTYYDDGLREKVVGEHNEILFDNPATGQVAYRWVRNGEVKADVVKDDDNKVLSRVLISIRKNDDELLKVASEAVRELTSAGDVVVMLIPDIAAKLKHYFGVDNDKIKLFEPSIATARRNMGIVTDEKCVNGPSNDGPDLVCTLGGDGSLMYASQLFPGPCPPVLCVAGGSLGFLTPFSRDEMVDAIRISLGLIVKKDDDDEINSDDSNESKSWYDEYQDTPQLPLHMTSKMKESFVDENGVTWTGSYSVPRSEAKVPKKTWTRFGSNNQICLSLRMRLECQLINSEGIIRDKFNVLNEVVIDRGSSPYLAALECFCDDVHLTTVQADGVIFSTPTGSTAYSMAAGGSVCHPAVPAILVTPICPHVLSFRSMVFPDHVVLRCYVPDDARADASVAFDGKHRRELHRGDSVQIQMSPYPVPTINRVDHSSDWLTSLKRNFNFNTRARQMPL